MRHLASGSGMAAAMLLLASASGAAASSRVTLQLKWHHQFQFAGYYAAQFEGFYAAEGLEVEIIEGSASRPPIDEVLSGRAEFGIGDSDVLLAYMRGRPLVVCAAVFQHSPYVLLSRRDRGIRTPSDLVGARVMLSNDQGASQFLSMLVGEGIEPSGIEILPHSWNLDDLVENRVDAVSAYETVEPARLRARGIEPAILRSSEYGADFYGDTLFTTASTAERSPELVAAFVRASMRGWEHALEHPEELAERILSLPGVRQGGLTRELLLEEARSMRELIRPDLVAIGHMNPARWRQIERTLVDQGLAPKERDLAGFLFEPGPPTDRLAAKWAIGALAIGFVVFALVALWNLQMRRQVARRTQELCSEIRQREAAQAELRESEERFRQIAENIRELFWMATPDRTRMLYVSPAYEAIWGRTTRSLLDDPGQWLEAIHPQDRDRVAERGRRGPSEGYDETYRVVRPGGEERWVHERAYPVLDEEGVVRRVVGIAEDITDRRRIEQQLLRSQRVESLGTLAGGISHDLNNLFAPILMSVELIRSEEPAPPVRDLVDTIETSAKRGADLVRQLLDFARGAEGARSMVEVGALARELRAIVESTFPKNIVFESSVQAGAWPVSGDFTQLSQVLLNLALNARDAMPRGGRIGFRASNVTVEKAASSHGPRPGRYLLLELSDNGEGIPAEMIGRIFDPFFTTKEVGKGSGLGLPTALGIIRRHGGEMDVQSTVGVGTTIRIHLPAADSLEHLSGPPGDLAVPDPPRGVGELILLVDDERAILSLTRRVLELAGYRVVTADNGAHAIGLFSARAAEISLVLTDLSMPAMDGTSLIAALRKVTPALPILATSGNADEATSRRLEELGVFRLLAKPYGTEALLSAIREALTRGSRAL